VAAALALRARGEEVLGMDDGTPAGLEELSRAGVDLYVGEPGVAPPEQVRTVVKSPGVPADAPVIVQARSRGICVLGEIELAWRMLPNEFIAVTGTNGKTTTVELIGHIHRRAGLPAVVAGNVGAALSGFVGQLDEHATIVCEVSSFQLEDTLEFAPQSAVLLNVVPDHLDRHGTLEAYRAAKLEIFARQSREDVAVVPVDFQPEGLPGAARRVNFGAGPHAQLSAQGASLFWQGVALLQTSELSLRGRHNVENAMAAAAACLARGLDPVSVRAALRDFAGVPHRLEELASSEGVLFVNDSKATNVASTLVALEAFTPGSIHLILGGQGKGQDFSALREAVATRCRAVYLIGEDAPRIADALSGVDVAVFACGELERAVGKARDFAQAGEVVLLSPACASFDQFADFEDRGERFRECVSRL
jgi:UDP-N-acetylmuramoylalanine--D-glutamate ligase